MLRLLRLSLVALSVGLAASPVSVAAQSESASAALKLDRIRLQVAETEERIEKIQAEFDQLISKRNEVVATIKRLKRDDQTLEAKLMQVEEERKALAAKVEQAEREVARQRERNGKRLRAMYMQTALAETPLVLGKVDRGQVERVSVYSRSVRESDKRRFDALRRAMEELVAARIKLEESMREAQGLREEIKLMRSEAEKQQSALETVVKEIRAKKEAAQSSLITLKREALDLEHFIASLTTGKDDEETPSEEEEQGSEQPEGAQAPERSESVAELAREPRLDPRGLFGARASLSAPVKGSVVQHYGKVKLASFKDVLFSKGIEFSTKNNDEVHAVLGGTVAYTGTLPGYDTVVILDHGSRSYSLYGRLGSSSVKKGDVVGKDQVVGTTSVADAKGRNFYFEVRRSGKPVDPETVLPRVSR